MARWGGSKGYGYGVFIPAERITWHGWSVEIVDGILGQVEAQLAEREQELQQCQANLQRTEALLAEARGPANSQALSSAPPAAAATLANPKGDHVAPAMTR